MDRHDSLLGAYHGWVIELATHFEKILVICLEEGEHTLPENVEVYSLGKEHGAQSRAVYAFRFLSLAWKLRAQYDRVFVHMNQEYILLAGPLWRFLKKPIYLWRNHYAGSLGTDIAAFFCKNVFCTSSHSYTARYKRTILMPVGVDTARFFPDETVSREDRSILFLARIAPSKRLDIFIEALGLLLSKSVSFVASVYGSPLPEHEFYYQNLQTRAEALGLHNRVRFYPGVPNEKVPDIFRRHEIFVNCSPSGMFDKTIFEAAASGCLILASSEDFRNATSTAFQFETAAGLADNLQLLLSVNEKTRGEYRATLDMLVHDNALTALGLKLFDIINPRATL
ncbi:MAG: glycosyltransferase family 4 protein [Minisyncoccia bacterium]